jgi:hypothetical protein
MAGDHSAIETIANLGVPHPDAISLQQFVRPICAVFTAENGYKVFYPLGFLDQTTNGNNISNSISTNRSKH